MQSADNPDALKCKVCNADYMVEKGSQFSLSQGFTAKQWITTASIITVMCSCLGGCWAVIQIYSQPWVRGLAVGVALLIQYVCLRSLGLSTVTAYTRAKVSALKIVNLKRKVRRRGGGTSSSNSASTVSANNLNSLRTIERGQTRI